MGMADRHNSTLAVRASDRKYAEPEPPETAESDPLTELARVVSGRGLSGAAAAARVRGNAGAPGPAPVPGPNMLSDLEAEMMGNVQASFTVVESGAAPLDQAESEPAPEPESEPESESPTDEEASVAQTAAPAKRAEGIVRDRLTDALAALAPA